MKRTLFATAILALAAAAPLAAQQSPMQRISAEPYIGYNFFGTLPDAGANLEGAVAYGARIGYQLAPQWSLYGNYQRSTPDITWTGAVPTIAPQSVNVDQWSAGVEFSYVPRGGAEGMLPIQLEAGLGQTRYGAAFDTNDLAVKLGVSSALQLSPNLAIRYGVDDYISNYRGDQGVVNQFTARIGAELRF
jgi:hypothetical protein